MGVAGKPRRLDLEWKLKNEDWKMGRLIVCVIVSQRGRGRCGRAGVWL